MHKRLLFQFVLLILILVSSFWGYLKYPHIFSLFENKLNDLMFIARGAQPADNNIVIIDIDEQSLRELGQWPWSRDIVAQILQNLSDYNIGIVGLDVVFAEHDNSSPKNVFKKLGKPFKNALDYDAILADTIANTPTIIGYIFNLTKDSTSPGPSPKVSGIFIEKDKPQNSFLIKPYRPILNIPIIQNSAYSNGYFNTIPDNDGIVRSIPLVMQYNGIVYPSLCLEMIRTALGIQKISINYFQNGVESIQLGNLIIPTDIFGRLLVNYKGEAHHYKYFSASDIFYKRISAQQLEGKIALFGTSAAGLLDLRSTPFDSVYPGVEVHATALDNIINQNFLSKPSWVFSADLFDILVMSILTFGIILIPRAFISFLLFLTLNIFLIFAHYYMMNTQGILLNTFFPIISIFTLFLVGESINYFLETKQKEKIKQKFATKVSSAVVEELIKNNQNDILEGKEEQITIFFSDIRGFTSISEAMPSAKDLIALLNAYMTPMVEIIDKYQGTVDKFIGDAIMAYWNAPIAVTKQADKALQASIEQIFELEKLNQKLHVEKKPKINIGIGLNSGISVVGEMGSSGRSDYTCIGDPVNLASRAEGLCKTYGAKIILTEFTKELLEESCYALRELDRVRVKGKEEPITIYECFGNDKKTWISFDEPQEKEYLEAMELYRKSLFSDALKIFLNLFENSNQQLYTLYIERCEHYEKHPPKDFDGVFTFTTK